MTNHYIKLTTYYFRQRFLYYHLHLLNAKTVAGRDLNLAIIMCLLNANKQYQSLLNDKCFQNYFQWLK